MNSSIENHLNCCRSCGKHLKSGMKAVEISKNIEKRFYELSGINLVLSELYSNVICESCNSKLSEFYDFKTDFAEYQNQLDAFVSRDETIREEIFTHPEVRAFPIKREIEICEEEEMLEEYHFDEQNNYSSPEEEETFPQQNESKSNSMVVQYKYCELCDRNVKANCYYSHFKRHHCEALLVCDLDGKRFKLKNDLRDHIRAHILKEDRKKFFCSMCKSSFFSTSALKNHCNYFHSGYIEEHPCDCGKIFGSRRKYRQHQINVHSGQKFTCETCGKSYESARSLRKHRINHTIGRIPCSVCGKLYYQQYMRDHMKTHDTSRTLFQCTSCLKTFYSQEKYSKHLKSHIAAKPFECTDCNSTYLNQSSYEQHRARIHPAVKSFCLAGCGKEFSRKETAIRHYKSKTHIHKDLDAATRRAYIEDVRSNKNLSW